MDSMFRRCASPRLFLTLSCALGAACAGTESTDRQTTSPDSGVTSPDAAVVMADAGIADAGTPDSGVPEPLALTTTAFSQGEVIPLRYECGGMLQGPGENISPDLAWSGGPLETESFAIVMDDVDSGVVHWVVYDIPKDVFALAENVPPGYEPAILGGAKQAEIQGSTYFGYFGPCSPQVVNTYRWRIHAIGTPTLQGATRQTTEYDMVDLIEAQSLASDRFTGES